MLTGTIGRKTGFAGYPLDRLTLDKMTIKKMCIYKLFSMINKLYIPMYMSTVYTYNCIGKYALEYGEFLTIFSNFVFITS